MIEESYERWTVSEAPRCKSALSRVDFVLYSRYCKIHARHAGAIGQAFLFGLDDSCGRGKEVPETTAPWSGRFCAR